MNEPADRLAPGTVMPYTGAGGMFETFRPLIQAADGLTLSQVCAVTGLEASTVQNWVKRGFVARPVRKKYRERHLARILLISALRCSMRIEDIGELMALVNGSADDTSDDIISEEQLYDDLCEIMRRSQDAAPDMDVIPDLVRAVTADYIGPTEDAERRLRGALGVMVCACTAARYKQEAEKLFSQLKEER